MSNAFDPADAIGILQCSVCQDYFGLGFYPDSNAIVPVQLGHGILCDKCRKVIEAGCTIIVEMERILLPDDEVASLRTGLLLVLEGRPLGEKKPVLVMTPENLMHFLGEDEYRKRKE